MAWFDLRVWWFRSPSRLPRAVRRGRRPSFRPRLEGLETRMLLSNYYVSTTGNDGWDGKAASWNGTDGPWATIQHAANQTFNPGDIVYVEPGTYNERVVINHNDGGNSSGRIWFDGETNSQYPDGPYMRGFELEQPWQAIENFEIRYIQNISVSEATGYSTGTGVYVTSSDNIIQDLYIHDIWRDGIVVGNSSTGTTNNIIRDNNIYHVTDAGIIDGLNGNSTTGPNSTNDTINNNTVTYTVQWPADAQISAVTWAQLGSPDADGIRLYGSGHSVFDNSVHDIYKGQDTKVTINGTTYQESFGDGDNNSNAPHRDMFETDGPLSSTTINANTGYWPVDSDGGNPSEGMEISSADATVSGLTITNNVIYHTTNAIQLNNNGHTISSFTIENNTFAWDDSTSINFNGVTGTNYLESNIFYNVGGGGDFYINAGSATVVTTFTANGNTYKANDWYNSYYAYGTFGQGSIPTPLENAVAFQNPGTNPPTNSQLSGLDYHLTSDSGVNQGNGSLVSGVLATDHDGKTRKILNTYFCDMGAYDYA